MSEPARRPKGKPKLTTAIVGAPTNGERLVMEPWGKPETTPVIPNGEPMAPPEGVDSRKGTLTRLANLAKEDDDLEPVLIALRLRKYTQKQIADGLGLDVQRVRRLLARARSGGRFADVLEDLTTEAVPLAVEGLLDHLRDGREWAIKETLHGMGLFRTYSDQQSSSVKQETTLSVTFTVPEKPIVLDPQNIVGQTGAPPIDVSPAGAPGE